MEGVFGEWEGLWGAGGNFVRVVLLRFPFGSEAEEMVVVVKVKGSRFQGVLWKFSSCWASGDEGEWEEKKGKR